MVQLARIYLEMLQVYKMYSTFISREIQQNRGAADSVMIRYMRGVKKEVLRLVTNFVAGCGDADKEVVYKQFLPPLIDPVLDDYKRNVPEARDAEVLLLFSAVVDKLGVRCQHHLRAWLPSSWFRAADRSRLGVC
jgi:exportin-1